MTKWSLGFYLFGKIVGIVFRSFYNKIESDGKKNIPNKKPIIFAANHQNALMDPLGVLFTSNKQSVFLTRADLFQNPILLKIFTFFKMLPVYRMRDGKDALKNNERIFNTSVEILEANLSIALFPEATHTDKRHLRPTKKAVPKIAFQAEANNDFKLDLQIVPVGIYYENYTESNSDLFINYGEPITITGYKEEYENNEQKAYLLLKTRIEDAIRPLIIDEPDMDHYELYEGIRIYYRAKMLNKLGLTANKIKNKFKADKTTVESLRVYFVEEKNDISKLDTAYSEFNAFCNKKEIRAIDNKDVSFISIISRMFLFLIGFPIFIFGFINNIIYYKFIINLLKKVKDQQLYSSIKFAISLAISFVIYPIQAAILWAIVGDWRWALAYLISLQLTALFANKYRYSFKKFKIDYTYRKLCNSTDIDEYLAKKESIDKIMDEVMG